MAGEISPRSESRIRVSLGFLYTQALTDNQNTNQGGIRAVRLTESGFTVQGHASEVDAAYDAQVNNVPTNFLISVAEHEAYLLLIENNMNEPVTLDLLGVGTQIEVPLETATVIAPGAQFVQSYTDPWVNLDVTLTGPAAPTGGNVTVEGLRRT